MNRVSALAIGLIFLVLVGGIGNNAVAQAGSGQNAVLKLDTGWEFRQVQAGQGAEEGWLPAKVPGDVHLDLLANKKIDDPFFRDNESKLQWIEKASWEYRSTFDVPATLLTHKNVDLVFEGLDAACDVSVNGVEVLEGQQQLSTVWRVADKG